ncbi:threonine--tRNA ligase [Streptobacillus moniliformis]|uniref:Threonine--tRNA ligase n=1 Tax=Streptobacillus moniliformis (strain ATCC 14647 / DSM 12112 / NCTC 10651 / 9901) TaxID=519441 RepID=D1AX49_STRM9|nr:threonine--tRNA ligase [Streptobacillus moniliformis]ACZ00875.1 threonyl-tRNA synthetase [Streptobacillus moniliformis DSM 12112]AVL43708.1 threonine--tRNA ligase [Streptobacillus moniliformis]SQA13988.1 Threonine--tRNA ligase [Streptobacillus moniliformis]
MLKITLPDGALKEVENMTVIEFAKTISTSLAKKTVGAFFNGTQVDITYNLDKDGTLELITTDSKKGLEILRHSSAHVMAEAVMSLFPNTKVTIGPAIENGFYYDFDTERPFTEEDLVKIEKEMKKIIKLNEKFSREVWSREKARAYFENAGQNYKVEILDSLEEDEFTIYTQGKFVDLCRGTHVPSTGYIKAFKLLNAAGAYWRGDSNNKMLQRIYGTSFYSQDELDAYIKQVEEAEKRDHRKLGKQLNLFFIDEHGPGFPFFMPKGMRLFNRLQQLWRIEHNKQGYDEIRTPIMLDKELWEISGHWFNYRENMYVSEIDEKVYAIKPMNCPGSIIAYKNNLHSYKDLPLKYAEMGHVHRHEFSGALHGLMRVRAFTQDDAHVFCTPDQIKDSIKEIVNLYDKYYKLFGFDFHVELSTKPEKAVGDAKVWEISERALEETLKELNIDYRINAGDGAFYGPKIDFKMKDSIGRIWQTGTIQLDMNLPKRFNMSYIGKDGEKHETVMIHRAMFGSLERFIGILIEHYAGAFPVWLAPTQVKIMTISAEQVEYATKLHKKLIDLGIYSELDIRDEKIGYKIREANGEQKIPVQLVIGKNEVLENTVNVRRFGSTDSVTKNVDEFINELLDEINIKF